VHIGDDNRVGAEQHHGTVLVITSFGPHGHAILAARTGVGPWPSR
jgi:hypothetical protein